MNGGSGVEIDCFFSPRGAIHSIQKCFDGMKAKQGPLPFNSIPFLHLAQREKRNGVDWKACRRPEAVGAPFSQHQPIHFLQSKINEFISSWRAVHCWLSWLHSLSFLLFDWISCLSLSRRLLLLAERCGRQPPLTHSKSRRGERHSIHQTPAAIVHSLQSNKLKFIFISFHSQYGWGRTALANPSNNHSFHSQRKEWNVWLDLAVSCGCSINSFR